MTWPTVDVNATNTDADTDSPLSARADFLDLIQKFNQLRAHVTTFIATLLDDADASAALSTLGVSTYFKTLLDDADAGTAQSTLGIAAFIKTLLDDADAATARGTLGVDASGIPQNSQSANYTTVLADAQKHILHPTADNNPRNFTINSNANVAYPVGTCLTFVNEINVLTIAITSDTLVLAGAGSTGSRTLAAMGIATALKKTSTSWIISGVGLT